MSTFGNLGIGDVLVMEGKMPVTPETYDGEDVMQSGQTRYWSLCMNESPATVYTSGCLSDYQVPLGQDRGFTIVMSPYLPSGTYTNKENFESRACPVRPSY